MMTEDSPLIVAAGAAKGRTCALVVGGTHPERQRIGARPTLVCGRFGLRRGRRGIGTRQPFASGSVSAMSQSR
jgi:hypothetical protein